MRDVNLDFKALEARFNAHGLGAWNDQLLPLLRSRFSIAAHGELERWQSILTSLPDAASERQTLEAALLALSPWRKGPFEVGGVTIDAEWRSDRKWARLADAIEPLVGRRVLDVGCGNGYYAFQMKSSGADVVIGIDPTLLYVMQFIAINYFVAANDVSVLPLRLQELPSCSQAFDSTFSMGVLYHQRSPLDHLQQLRETLRPGGQLVLETIYLPGEESYARTPANRYARMRNVWLLPTVAELTTWLRRAGFRDVEIIDQSVTSTEEQRTTDWMTFESLAAALDAGDSTRTVEGWPAPRRVVATAIAP